MLIRSFFTFPHLLNVNVTNSLTTRNTAVKFLQYKRPPISTYKEYPILAERAFPAIDGAITDGQKPRPVNGNSRILTVRHQ